MKLQYLAVIFVIIILPISLVLSFYMNAQMETIHMQTNYTSKLSNATYDAVKAFQLNTTNNYYSSVSDSKIRDIEASVNSFYNSLTTSLKYSKSDLQAYVPALVYTLYDGYYVYSKRYNVYEVEKDKDTGELEKVTVDTELNNANQYEYGLKPFVYYSCRYRKDSRNDFIVNFTLDNFISIYGTVNGEYITKTGYLINPNNWNAREKTYKGAKIEESEILTEYLRFTDNSQNGVYQYVVHQNRKVYFKQGQPNNCFWYDKGEKTEITNQEIKNYVARNTTSAVDYYQSAADFSKWVTENIGEINQTHIQPIDGENLEIETGTSSIFDMTKQDPDDKVAIFNQHRIAVIKTSIQTNLLVAINSYNTNSRSYAYALPKLTDEDWDKVVNNVCMISFLQGLPIGGKYFNNYVVIPNDKNNEFVDEDSIYLLTEDGQYHMVNDKQLVENANGLQSKITSGYRNSSFQRQTVKEKETKIENGEEVVEEKETYYYYHILNGIPYTGCYYCIVNSSNDYEIEDIINATNNKLNKFDITKLRSKYLTILAREKYDLYKTNSN